MDEEDKADEDTFKHPIIDTLLVLGGFFSFSFLVLAVVAVGIGAFVWLSFGSNFNFWKGSP